MSEINYKEHYQKYKDTYKAYYERNKDSLLAEQKKYYKKNKSIFLENQKEHYQKNRKKLKDLRDNYKNDKAHSWKARNLVMKKREEKWLKELQKRREQFFNSQE